MCFNECDSRRDELIWKPCFFLSAPPPKKQCMLLLQLIEHSFQTLCFLSCVHVQGLSVRTRALQLMSMPPRPTGWGHENVTALSRWHEWDVHSWCHHLGMRRLEQKAATVLSENPAKGSGKCFWVLQVSRIYGWFLLPSSTRAWHVVEHVHPCQCWGDVILAWM